MSDLDRLFYWRGIAPDFYNFNGELTPVSVEKRVQILRAMGVDVSSDRTIRQAAFELDTQPWLSWLSAMTVVDQSHVAVAINFSPDELSDSFTWRLEQNGRDIHLGVFRPEHLREIGDYVHQSKRYSRRELVLSVPEPNYFNLILESGKRSQSTVLAAVPPKAYLPEWVDTDDENPWGFVVQLYTLRSDTNWGIGDFTDLKTLISGARNFGVDIIGLNPFHTLQSDLREHFSPYSPSDRRFLNPLYIDVRLAPGYDSDVCDEQAIATLRALSHVDYCFVRDVKYRALFTCFERFMLDEPERLADFIESSESEIVDFANFEALTNWQPEDFVAQPVKCEALLSALRDTHAALPASMHLVGFHCYLQWVAEYQLEQCQHLANQLGMKVGIVRDLAVGASGGGSEAQTNPKLFCSDAAIGAPPDPFAHGGQNWGIPPMDPAELRNTAYKHFIELLRTNMTHCGALRIDHAMSLYRLWWCPADRKAADGAYIYYPFKELLGLLCLESHLNKCMIIAEDLGNVPDEFRAAMRETGLFSNRLFYFEKWNDREFKHPSQYERHALAMLDNHDVPTLVSWWNGSDLSLRIDLGLLGNEDEQNAHIKMRCHEKAHLFYMLKEDGFLPEAWRERSIETPIDQALLESIVRFVSQSNSQFFILQLEDLLRMNDPVNVPGTHLEHKNWSRKLSKSADDIFSDASTQALLNGVAETRNN